MTAYEYEYKGYKFWHDMELEEDNAKLWHCVLTPTGTVNYVDWSPYSEMSESDFKLWIDLGKPDRYALKWCVGPLCRDDLNVLKDRK